MSMREISLRPFQDGDKAQLDLFRENYWDADLEIPYGYSVEGSVSTAVAEKNGETVGALTGTKVIVFDFMKNPAAAGVDIFSAVLMLERTLSYVAQQHGMMTAYIAIPSHLEKYIDMVKSCGYTAGFEGCTILRRSLGKEAMPSIAEARDGNVSK